MEIKSGLKGKDELRLTVEKIKNDPEFEHLTDEEASELLDSIYQFCEIVCVQYLEQNNVNYESTRTNI